MKRILSVALLFFLVSSNAMLGAHAATHVPADLTECEYCSAYNDPLDGVAFAGISLPPAPRHCYTPEFHPPVEAVSIASGFRQRAPPPTI